MQLSSKHYLKRKTWIVVILAVLVFLSAGCGFRWWYDYADMLLLRSIDQYFDLTSQQEDFLEPQIEKHLTWHRRTGIPRHISFFVEIRNKIEDGLDKSEIDWFFQLYPQQITMLIQELADDALHFLGTVSDEQIDDFEEELKEDNEKYEKRLALSKEERLEKRAEKTVEFVEDWVGSLNTKQENEVMLLSKNLPDNFEPWYRGRVKRQNNFVKLLRNRQSKPALKKALFELVSFKQEETSTLYYADRTKMILAIDRMMTPKQRIHAMDKLKDWIDDFSAFDHSKIKN